MFFFCFCFCLCVSVASPPSFEPESPQVRQRDCNGRRRSRALGITGFVGLKVSEILFPVWCASPPSLPQCLPGRCKPTMPRTAIVKIRGSMVLTRRSCMIRAHTPAPVPYPVPHHATGTKGQEDDERNMTYIYVLGSFAFTRQDFRSARLMLMCLPRAAVTDGQAL